MESAFVEPRAALIICSFNYPDYCTGIHVTNNIAAGTIFAGFSVMGHDCGDYSTNEFKNNIAHSIFGFGANIFPDPTRP